MSTPSTTARYNPLSIGYAPEDVWGDVPGYQARAISPYLANWDSRMYGGDPYGGMLQHYGADLDFRKAAHADNMRMAQAQLDAGKLSPFQQGVQTFGTIAQGLQGLGSMYLGWQSMKEQKRNNAFQRDVMNTNINNSISDYNRRLTDTLNNRALNNGGGDGWVSSQLEKYQAKRG